LIKDDLTAMCMLLHACDDSHTLNGTVMVRKQIAKGKRMSRRGQNHIDLVDWISRNTTVANFGEAT
jgi:hypothetical protein